MNQSFLRLGLVAGIIVTSSIHAAAQLTPSTVQLFNPNWNITLTDAGYSDWLYDNTPGLEGREYLSGEWGAAVGYRKQGSAQAVSPKWLEKQFSFPDWQTNSDFVVDTPITATAQKFNGLDAVATSTIKNSDLSIQINYEMLDTLTGKKMGIAQASSSTPASVDSNRYVLKQTYTLTNISGSTLQDINFFQMLHSYNGVTSLYDNRNYSGALSEYRYHTTQLAESIATPTSIDPVTGQPTYGPSVTLRDYVSFATKSAPVATDNGLYGVFGVDNHALGKPSEGVHIAIENDALTGTDYANPANAWVAGAQKQALGILAPGTSAMVEVVLSIRTGTLVQGTGTITSSARGGKNNVGGVEFSFERVLEAGEFDAEYDPMDAEELAERIKRGQFKTPDFNVPGKIQLFNLSYGGQYDGDISLTLSYDPTLLPAGFDETLLDVWHYEGGDWVKMNGHVDTMLHTITLTTGSLSPFAIGAVPEPASAGMLVMMGAAGLLRRPRSRSDSSR